MSEAIAIPEQDQLPELKTTTIDLKSFLKAKDLYEYFFKLSQEHGDFVLVKGLVDIIVVNHPELIKQLLKETNQSFDKRSPFYLRFRRMFGKGIVTSEDDDWRRQRNTLQPLFTTKGTRLFFESILSAVKDNAKRWEARLGETIDAGQEMNGIALDIVARAFLSKATFGKEKEKIESWVSYINQYIGRLPIPLLSEPWFPRPSSIKGWLARRRFRRFIGNLIIERRQNAPQEDLLSLLMNADHGYSQDDLIDQIMTLVFGGHETSATAMVWTWYLLAKNPQAEKRMHDELDQVLEGRDPKLSDLVNLRYTKACIEEAMRLYPPFWFENRNTKRDITLGATCIPKGKMVVFSRYSTHRHADWWEQPNKFMPERFLTSNEGKSSHRFSSVPFGGGPRICVGINFARMEILLVFAVLAQRYRLRLSEPSKNVDLVSDLTLSPKGGLSMVIERRDPTRQSKLKLAATEMG